jgi:phage terminase large subunit-like protein
MYPIPYPGLPSSITTGPAGAVWFTGITYVGRITTAGAITMWQMIDRARVTVIPDLERIVVAIDPAATAREDSDETGIVICGKGVDGHAYVLKDLSCRLSPEGWARRAITGYREFHADRMVAEVNNGGDMVESTVRMVDANVSFRKLTRWMPSFPGSGERSGAANRRRRY